MHIHPNNNLALASLGAGREELAEIQAKRATEVRKKLSSAARVIEATDGEPGSVSMLGRRAYEDSQREPDEDAFPRLFSAKA